jgi:hypothetical protein
MNQHVQLQQAKTWGMKKGEFKFGLSVETVPGTRPTRTNSDSTYLLRYYVAST